MINRAIDGRITDMCFFTICSRNFMAHARTLYFSLKQYYPDLVFYVALCDHVDGLDEQPFNVIDISELNITELEDMFHRYNITELNTAIKPFVFEYLFSKFSYKNIVYLDPDILIISRLSEVEEAFEAGAEVVVTPHILQPAENTEVHDQKMLQFGIYNLGFVAFQDTPDTKKVLAWWGRKLVHQCVIKLEEGLFVDQKWADLFPAFLKNVSVIHSPGYNVAYWNLAQRTIIEENGVWLSNGQPLRFVHFSGNRLDDKNTFSRHSQLITIESIGDLSRILTYYREQVFSNGHEYYRRIPYAFNWDGKSGENLHTPKDMDMSDTRNAESEMITSSPAVEEQSLKRKRSPEKIRIVLSALPVAIKLCGSWAQLLLRFWRAYRSHGWVHVKKKIYELSQFGASPYPIKKNISPADCDAPKSRKIIYLDWAIPTPDKDAASVTAVTIMRIFSSLGYVVTFIPCSLKYEKDYYESLIEDGVNVLCYPQIYSVEKWLKDNAGMYGICFMARGPVVWPYLNLLRSVSPSTRLIFYTVDLHYLREQRMAELSGNKTDLVAADKTRKYELELIENCDATVLLSSDEQYIIRNELPEASLTVLPIVFDRLPGAKKPFIDKKDILFIGSYPHLPNIDAVLYFAETVFPLVQKQLPDVKFKVVGANPPENIQRLSKNPGIEILGFVEDIESVFEDVRISVAPLRYGAGIKGKIGSSLCYGVPCVATSIAVEGMGLADGRDILVGDSPGEFADAILLAYTNSNVWGAISKRGHRFAVDNYSFEVIRERIEGVLWSVSEGWRLMESAYEIANWAEWLRHSDRLKKIYKSRVNREQSLLTTINSDHFSTSGFCCVCGRETTFLTSYMYSTSETPDGKPMPNWREHMQCEHCGLVNRTRAALNVLHSVIPPKLEDRIYITEQVTPIFSWLKNRYTNIQGSEYFGGAHSPGAIVDGLRHEDVMKLSFQDNSFDRVLSFDVLEHVADPDAAFKEVFRVLDEGGVFLFSVPFSSDSAVDIVRATLKEDGSIDHHLPPEIHGNPVDPEGGALCFRYFGWDMLDRLRSLGFVRVRAIAYWSENHGYLGKEQFLFVAHKSISQLNTNMAVEECA